MIVREQGTIFLGGPPLVKAATGEEVTAEELGGGDVHARTSGVVDHLADDDEHALEIVRAHRRDAAGAGARRRGSARAARPPADDPDDDPRRRPARHAHALRLARAAARGSSTASSSTSSRSCTARPSSAASRTSTATRSGSSPTTGSSSASRALKAAHFVELCDRRGIPLLFLQNISGFMVGREYEAGGIAKDGAKLVTAVALRARAEADRDRRRLLRRRQLRHVRPRLLAALPVHVAERAHQRDGRRAGGDGDDRGRPARDRRPAARAVRAPGPRRTTRPRASGTTA